MDWLHVLYWTGCAIGVLMFGTAHLIHKKKTPAPQLERLETPLMVAGATIALICAIVGLVAL